MISLKKVIDNNNLKTIKSFTNNFTLVYHSILFNKTFTPPIHLVKFNRLLTSIESLV